MRSCNIKIGNDGQVTVSQVKEYIEEHGATQLVITLNDELKAKGFVTISGRVNRQYFNERLYGVGKEDLTNACI